MLAMVATVTTLGVFFGVRPRKNLASLDVDGCFLKVFRFLYILLFLYVVIQTYKFLSQTLS